MRDNHARLRASYSRRGRKADAFSPKCDLSRTSHLSRTYTWRVHSPRRALPRFAVVFLVLYFLLSGAVYGRIGIERMSTHWDWLNDLHYFYGAGEIVRYDYHRDILYDPEARVEAGLGPGIGHEVFPFPASVALGFAPLTTFDIEDARLVFLWFSVLCGLAIVVLAYAWSRDIFFALLTSLAGVTLLNTYEVLRFSQLTLVLALLSCIGLVTMNTWHGRRLGLAAGALTALLTMKPSVAVAPLAVLVRGLNRWQIAGGVLAGALIVFIVPVALLGPDGVTDYIEQLSSYREEAFLLEGHLTAGAGWMLNWNGFVGKLTGENPSQLAVYGLDALTLLLFATVWLRGDVYHGWLAATLTTLLVIPHAVWYDWALPLGVAPFVLYTRRSTLLMLLLVGLHFSVSRDSYHILTSSVFDSDVFLTPLFALATLAYLAARSLLDLRAARTAPLPAPIEATA